jgi:hypothetical protein
MFSSDLALIADVSSPFKRNAELAQWAPYINHYSDMLAVLVFLNNLRGLGTEQE